MGAGCGSGAGEPKVGGVGVIGDASRSGAGGLADESAGKAARARGEARDS